MYTIYMKSGEAAWKRYAEIISTREDAESTAEFLSSIFGCEFRIG